MGHLTRALAATAAGVVLTAGTVGLLTTAQADESTPDPGAPCATQAAQVAKAEGALARVTAVFERKQAATDEAEADVAEATTPRERAVAKVALRKAQAAETKVAKAKKAQQMRLTKAQQRLDTCLAGQTPTQAPTDAPTDVPTDAPTDAPTDVPTSQAPPALG